MTAELIFFGVSLILITDLRSQFTLLLIYRYITGEAPPAPLNTPDGKTTAGPQISVKLQQLCNFELHVNETCHGTAGNVTCHLSIYILAAFLTGVTDINTRLDLTLRLFCRMSAEET